MNGLIEKNRSVILLFLLITSVIVGICVLVKMNSLNKNEQIVISGNENSNCEEKKLSKTLKVDIEGAVLNPGVYYFEEGAIVNDALNKAGGLNQVADLAYVSKNINKAEALSDEQKIYIPAVGEIITPVESTKEVSSSKSNISGKININTATLEELDSLPGIGLTYAQRIIDGRPYSSIEEIKNIKGIGDSTFEKIKDQITI